MDSLHLEEGAQVPPIYGNGPTKERVNQAFSRLDQAIQNLLFSTKVCKELVSETAAQLVSSTKVQELNTTTIQESSRPSPLIEQGAIKK